MKVITKKVWVGVAVAMSVATVTIAAYLIVNLVTTLLATSDGEPKIFVVSFIDNDIVVETIEIDLDKVKLDDKGSPIVYVERPKDLTRKGYNFAGWYDNKDQPFNFDKPLPSGSFGYVGINIYTSWLPDIRFDTKPLSDAVKGEHYDDTVGDMLYINEALLGKIESVKFDVDRSKGSLFGSWEVDGGGLGMYAIGFGDDGSFGTDYPLFQSVPIGVYNFEVEVEIKGLSVYSQAHYSITLKQTFSIRVVDPE